MKTHLFGTFSPQRAQASKFVKGAAGSPMLETTFLTVDRARIDRAAT